MEDNAVLCYVSGCWAYFTTKPLQDQWGDDWNDAPYQHNAGSPYRWRDGYTEPRYELYEAAWFGPFTTPEETTEDYLSVEDINAGKFPWLTPAHDLLMGIGKTGLPINAGVTWTEFQRLMRFAGGVCYVHDPTVIESR